MSEQLIQGVLIEDPLQLKTEKSLKQGELIVNSAVLGAALAAIIFFTSAHSYDTLNHVDYSQLAAEDVADISLIALGIVLFVLYGFIETVNLHEINKLGKELKEIDQFLASRADQL